MAAPCSTPSTGWICIGNKHAASAAEVQPMNHKAALDAAVEANRADSKYPNFARKPARTSLSGKTTQQVEEEEDRNKLGSFTQISGSSSS